MYFENLMQKWTMEKYAGPMSLKLPEWLQIGNFL